MTTFFLLVCGFSVVFFLVFLWQCGKPRRPAKNHGDTIRPAEIVTTDSMAGQRGLAHLEDQMAEYMTVQQRNAGVL